LGGLVSPSQCGSHLLAFRAWRGSISLGSGPDGKRQRRKVSGRSKAEVKDKLQALHDEIRDGIRSSARTRSTMRWMTGLLTGLRVCRRRRFFHEPGGPGSADRAHRGGEAPGSVSGGCQVGAGKARCHAVHKDCPARPQRLGPGDPLRRGERSRGAERRRARDRVEGARGT
jgi:hypothetical protein